MSNFIPVNEPLLDGNEKKYLCECIDTGWISSEGPFVERFEQQVADYVGRKHAIAVTNGTVALDIAIAANQIGPGDEVIVPTFTIISCVLQIIRAGATPVLVDANLLNFNAEIDHIEKKITKKTKAIMAVHIYGLAVDMEPLIEICDKYSLTLIEDAAEVIGQTYEGAKCGSFGDISTLSFYPNKHITTGEGGMLLTDDDELANECKKLRNLYFDNSLRFVHSKLGWNARMTNIQAALGLAQIERIEQFIVKKRWIGKKYNERLKHLNNVQLPLEQSKGCSNIYWVYSLVISENLGSSKILMDKLHQCRIGTRPFFYPMHLQPALRKLGFFLDESYPVSELLYNQGLYLPSGLNITEAQIDAVCDAVIKILS
jgi:perosamine synthetase